MKTFLRLLKFVLAALGVVALARAFLWNVRSSRMIARLRKQESPELMSGSTDDLPAPVARYFEAVLADDAQRVTQAWFSQRGEFLVDPAEKRYSPFVATEHFAPGGFVWDARIRLAPGANVRVRDAFVDGRGSMLASVFGVWPLVDVKGTPDIDAGALQRYLAEAAWLPTALLPEQGVAWTPLDDASARATITAGATTVSLDFFFDEDGLITRVFSESRPRLVDGESIPTPWEGRFSDYEECEGMTIPTRGEVAWMLPEGRQVYWRGEITEASFQ